ncbi:MAG: efflux RND transporter periplasmic adaptor subunit [Ferruginibacter sp.]
MQCIDKPAKYFFTLLFFSAVFVACKSKEDDAKKKPKETPPVVVDVIIGSAQPITNVIEANGTVIANEFVELHPEVSGRLTYLNFPEGKPIAQGTIVAKVNDADLRAQVAKSKVQMELVQKTVERYQQLLAINGINQADYDAAVNQVNGFKADIAYTQALIDKTVTRAPFSGVGGLRQVSPGAYVTPTTVIATLQQTSQVKIDFTIPDLYSNVIKVGALVDIELDATTQKRTQAQIIAVEPGANTDTRNLKVRAILKGGTSNPGGFVKVFVDAGQSRASIKIPTNCLIPDDRNNQVVLVKNGKADFVNVETGVREANTVEITKGINPGDSVVVTGVLFARPKGAVKVRSVKKLDDIIKTAEGN